MKALRKTRSGLLAATTVGLLMACSHTDQVTPASPAGAAVDPAVAVQSEQRGGVANMQAPGTSESVVERMARARCTGERTCGRVGPGRAFASNDECVEFMRASAHDTIDSLACALGVDQLALDDCLQSMDDEGCGDGVAELRRARRCRADVLCVK